MRAYALFAVVALIGAVVITRGLIAQPGYTDAFYHFNAARRLVYGQGLTDAYLWTYIGAPDTLPAPSHLYWMPFTSLVAAFGMSLFGDNYAAAQIPFALLLAGTAGLGYGLGARLGGTRRHAWAAGLVTLFSGFFTRFWGATDTFAPYALVGALCLICMGTAITSQRRTVLWVVAGILAGLGHLTRADGLLLLLVGWAVMLWPSAASGTQSVSSLRQRIHLLSVFTAGYLLVMTPWLARNISMVGSPLPVGGTQAIWFTEYNDLFNYPPDANPQTFFAAGVDVVFRSRWEALVNNLGTFVAVEGLIAMTPLMLVGLWNRRGDEFLRGFWLYALGLHLVMTFIFPFPGYRGGLLHSAAALVPWWAALGVVGVDDAVDWIARRRRRWQPRTAKRIFSAALVVIAVSLSVSIGAAGRVGDGVPRLYTELKATLPPDARLMVNDPAQLYYFTGFGGVVLPNEQPGAILAIARRYGITHLLLENVTDAGIAGAAPAGLSAIPAAPPDFLTPLPLDTPHVRLYAIRF